MSDAILSRRAALVKLGLFGLGAYAAPALLNLSEAEAGGRKSRKKTKKTKNCQGKGGDGNKTKKTRKSKKSNHHQGK